MSLSDHHLPELIDQLRAFKDGMSQDQGSRCRLFVALREPSLESGSNIRGLLKNSLASHRLLRTLAVLKLVELWSLLSSKLKLFDYE